MPYIRRRSPPEHLLIPDSNVLWCEDKALVVAPEFDQFWNSFASEFTLTLVVPEVVRGELLFQQTTSALKGLAKANTELARVSAVAGQQYAHRVSEGRVREDVASRLDRWLQLKRAQVEPTPIATIDWARLVTDAVWRNPPFEQDPKNAEFEKGFRDALVLETVRAVSAKVALGRRVAFVTADVVLRDATALAVSAYRSSTCYESVDELASYLRLTKEKLDEQFVRAIQARASKRFFNRADPNCLFWEAKIATTIRQQFAAELAKPLPTDDPVSSVAIGLGLGVQWEAVTNEGIRIAAAQFDRLEGGHNFFWKTPITFAQAFRCSWLPSESLQGVDFPERLRIVMFEVNWKARVKKDGRFHDLTVSDITCVRKEFSAFEDRDLNRYGLTRLRVVVTPLGGAA